jgi:hypothetical protein
VAPAQQALTTATAAAANLPKMIEAQTAAVKGAQAKATADQAAAAAAQTTLHQAQGVVERLKAAMVTKTAAK